MDKDTRNRIEHATQSARSLLEQDLADQLEGTFDIRLDGTLATEPGSHLDAAKRVLRRKLVTAVEHNQAGGQAAPEAVATYLREAAFTTLNRFVALKMLEARDLVQECISRGEQSAGFKEFCGLAPGLVQLPDHGYRLYIESLFDELSTEVKVLFDRRDPYSVLWPNRATFEQLLETLNATDLAGVWGEYETIGWVYQFFIDRAAVKDSKKESQAPRNSQELAERNQFFTPRYVIQFLTDNTLGRIWYEMRGTKTALADQCEYMVRKPSESFDPRAKKDPRDLRVLDPACGSGHFLLYAFGLLVLIHEEAWADPESPKNEATGRTLAEDYPSLDALRKALPGLILAHNLHGVDIDPRCAQIAQLALWMRAQKAYRDFGIGRTERPQIRRSNIVVAEPLIADEQIAQEFVAKLGDPELGRVFMSLVEFVSLAGDLGILLRVEQLVARPAKRGQTGDLFAPPEERIRAALEQFVRDEAGATNMRRRLFTDDTAHGIALLGVAEKKFDVVLMNPPFGRPTPGAKPSFSIEVPENLYAWFMLRGAELLDIGGLCGCITDSTWLRQPTFRQLRTRLLLETSLVVLVDLGWGVLDANVRTCMQVFGASPRATYLIGDASDPNTRVSQLIAPMKERSNADTERLPKAVIVPSFGPREAIEVTRLRTLGTTAQLPWGCGANDSFRLFRLRWEVDWEFNNEWRPMANGGPFSPFYRENHLVCRVGFKGVVAFDVTDGEGEKLWDGSAREFIGQAGLTYPKRSEYFHVAPLPAGTVVTPEGKGLFPLEEDLTIACAVANSTLVTLMASFLCGPHKQRGDVALLPLPSPKTEQRPALKEASRRATTAVFRAFQASETSATFTALIITPSKTQLCAKT